MEKMVTLGLPRWKELMTIKLEEDYSSIDAVIKDLLKRRRKK